MLFADTLAQGSATYGPHAAAKQNHPARDILLNYYRIRPTVSSAILDFDEFQPSMRQ